MGDLKLRAEFVMTAPGQPEVVTTSGEIRVYAIRLFVENVSDDVYAVTYELHPSYYDRMRDVAPGRASRSASRRTVISTFAHTSVERRARV
jgi:hypothetical protein